MCIIFNFMKTLILYHNQKNKQLLIKIYLA